MSGEEINKKLKASIREFYRAISANLKPAEAMHTELMPVVTSKHSVHVQSVYNIMLTPFTPKSDQFQISSAASPEIYHHSQYEELGQLIQMKDILPILPTSLKGWEVVGVLLEIGSESVEVFI